jgi:hypothetical protein
MMDCDKAVSFIPLALLSLSVGYIFLRDFLHRREDADRRELWALREKYKPGCLEEANEKLRLAELERKYL